MESYLFVVYLHNRALYSTDNMFSSEAFNMLNKYIGLELFTNTS